MEKDKVKISDYVLGLRSKEGLTVRAFGEKYNISRSQVSRYENGSEDNPTLLVATKFCNKFSISFEKFKDEFFYMNKKIDTAFSTAAQLKYRNIHELDSNYPYKVIKGFYDLNKDVFGLYDLNKYQKDNDDIIDINYICKNKNNELIYLCYFLYPQKFFYKNNNQNFAVIGKAIADVACYSEEELKCKNFVFFTPSKDVFNFYKTKKYNKHLNNLLLIYVSDNDDYKDRQLLFGKSFL